jgi:hypothetical protein
VDDQTYVPFHVRQEKSAAQHLTLVEGVPEWLWASLWNWCLAFLGKFSHGFRVANAEAVRHVERALHRHLPFVENNSEPFPDLMTLLRNDHDLFLSVAEVLVNYRGGAAHHHGFAMAPGLRTILSEAGSAYELSDLQDGVPIEKQRLLLLHRVAPTVKVAYEDTLSKAGKAGQYLEEAWHYVYRRHPDPSAGYRKAINAVEAVAVPIFLPKDPLATLGKVIGRMKEGGDKFSVCLQPLAGNAIDKVRALCELIWTAQIDRHGSANPAVPLNVTNEEAAMALHAAITLVHWFSTGTVTLQA